MTAKRYAIKPSMIVDDVTVIIDNQKEYTFPVLDSTLNYMFYKVLNEQHETIQRLKQNIDELLSINVEEELLKENEQLQQQNKMLRTNVGKLTDDITYLRNLPSTHQKENKQLKSEYKVLHTQYQDLKKFVENNFDEHLTQEKLNRQIIKLSEENEQLKCENELLRNTIEMYDGKRERI